MKKASIILNGGFIFFYKKNIKIFLKKTGEFHTFVDVIYYLSITTIRKEINKLANIFDT